MKVPNRTTPMGWLAAISRRLYLRIWLAVAGSVAVLSLVVGWAWHLAEEDRERERERQANPTREILVRNAAGEVIGRTEAQLRRQRGQPPEVVIRLRDGQLISFEVAPHAAGLGPPRRPPTPPLAWLRPPYGFQWMLALAGLGVMIGVFPVVRRLTQRLEALQRDVQRWGEGDLSVRLPESGEDEVADLSRRFNDAARRIEGLMATQAALLQSQKSLLANASHELRSPLARIRMAIELSGTGGSPTARAELERNIAELDQLVDEILLASRLDAREADMGTVESVDLIGLVAEECARVGASFELAPGTTEILVPGVVKLLRRAVRNLLENAVRHGARTGRASEVSAELRLDHASGLAVLDVSDRGPGVPAGQRERIFEPFYRMPGASEREGGVGLGLALVRSIAARHGGGVACGDREGGGARFTLTLPAAS